MASEKGRPMRRVDGMKLVKILIVGFIVLLFSFSSGAFAGNVSDEEKELYKIPERYYTGESSLWSCYRLDLEDGHFVKCTSFDISGPRDRTWVSKLDKDWNRLWDKELGIEAYDAHSGIVLPIDDKSVILGGTIYEKSNPYRSASAWVVRLDVDDGSIKWQRTYRFGWDTHIYKLKNVENGVLVLGTVRAGNHDDSGFIAELSLDGEKIWSSPLEIEGFVSDVLPHSDGFLLIGKDRIINIGKNGTIFWDRKLGKELDGFVTEIINATTDGGIVLKGGSARKPWKIKIAPDGATEWVKKLDKDERK